MFAKAAVSCLVSFALAMEASSTDISGVKVRGYVGRRMGDCIQNHLQRHDAVYLTDPYKNKTEDHYWQCEFWGKWMHSAAPFLSYTGSSALRANIAASVENLLPCQEARGYLGNYAPDARCGTASKTSYGGWDVWCQKYTLLGLLYAEESFGDRRCLDAVVTTAKNVIDDEINIVGGAASQELWYHGKVRQTHPYYRMNETCVVTTWHFTLPQWEKKNLEAIDQVGAVIGKI